MVIHQEKTIERDLLCYDSKLYYKIPVLHYIDTNNSAGMTRSVKLAALKE